MSNIMSVLSQIQRNSIESIKSLLSYYKGGRLRHQLSKLEGEEKYDGKYVQQSIKQTIACECDDEDKVFYKNESSEEKCEGEKSKYEFPNFNSDWDMEDPKYEKTLKGMVG